MYYYLQQIILKTKKVRIEKMQTKHFQFGACPPNKNMKTKDNKLQYRFHILKCNSIFFSIQTIALDTKAEFSYAAFDLSGRDEIHRRILKVDEAHCNNNENDVQTISHTKAETLWRYFVYCRFTVLALLYLVFFTQHLLGKLCHIVYTKATNLEQNNSLLMVLSDSKKKIFKSTEI